MIAPDVGGGFGGKLQVTPEEFITFAVATTAGQASQVHRNPQRVAAGSPTMAGTRCRRLTLAATKDGTVTGTARSTCSPTWAHTSAWWTPAIPILGAYMYNAIYKFAAYRFECQEHLDQHGPH